LVAVVRGVEAEERGGVADRRRTQDEPADHGEDGGVGADAESQREDSDRGEGRGFADPAQRVSHITRQRSEGCTFARIADGFFSELGRVEFQASQAAGLGLRESARDVAIDDGLVVGLYLGVELGFHAITAKWQLHEPGSSASTRFMAVKTFFQVRFSAVS
jgi:hypothetical protein